MVSFKKTRQRGSKQSQQLQHTRARLRDPRPPRPFFPTFLQVVHNNSQLEKEKEVISSCWCNPNGTCSLHSLSPYLLHLLTVREIKENQEGGPADPCNCSSKFLFFFFFTQNFESWSFTCPEPSCLLPAQWQSVVQQLCLGFKSPETRFWHTLQFIQTALRKEKSETQFPAIGFASR
jgi:hypothetical protein